MKVEVGQTIIYRLWDPIARQFSRDTYEAKVEEVADKGQLIKINGKVYHANRTIQVVLIKE